MPHYEESLEQRLEREESILRGDATSKYLHLDKAEDIQRVLETVRTEIQQVTEHTTNNEDPDMHMRRLKMEETVLLEFLAAEQG